jgi:hypothetical protein
MNKETLQTNNTRLQTNNTDLNTILETVNNLPSGGGSAVTYQPGRISFSMHHFLSNEDGTPYDMRNEISNIDTSKVTSLASSFSYITGVLRIDLSSWNTSSCEDFINMFEQSEFEYIDVSNFTFDRAFNLANFIIDCYNLTTLILGEGWLNINSFLLEDPNGFTPGGGGFGDIAMLPLISGTPINDGSGYIYVPDELVDQFKEHEIFSEYADQIKPKSELV